MMLQKMAILSLSNTLPQDLLFILVTILFTVFVTQVGTFITVRVLLWRFPQALIGAELKHFENLTPSGMKNLVGLTIPPKNPDQLILVTCFPTHQTARYADKFFWQYLSNATCNCANLNYISTGYVSISGAFANWM